MRIVLVCLIIKKKSIFWGASLRCIATVCVTLLSETFKVNNVTVGNM